MIRIPVFEPSDRSFTIFNISDKISVDKKYEMRPDGKIFIVRAKALANNIGVFDPSHTSFQLRDSERAKCPVGRPKGTDKTLTNLAFILISWCSGQ